MTALVAALSIDALRRSLLGYFVFIVAEEAAWLGILLYAHQVGGLAAVGFVAVAQLVPATFAAPLSATLVDRLPRKAALIVAYGSVSLAILATGLALSAKVQAEMVYVLAVVVTSLITLGRPAHFAALPRFSGSPSKLVAANAASSTLDGLGVLVGPVAVALAVTTSSIAPMFMVLGALLGLATLWLSQIERSSQFPSPDNEAPPRESFLASMVLGVLEIRRIRGAFTLLILVGLGFVLQGALDVLGVAFAMEVLEAGETGVSLLAGANGLGGLLGAAATFVLVGRVQLVPVFVLATVLCGVSLALVGIAQMLLLAAAFVLCSGMARAFADVAGRTLLHRNVKERAMARVFGLQEMVLTGGMALGATLAPLAVVALGTREAFGAIGLAFASVALLGLGLARPLDQAGERAAGALSLLRSQPLFAELHADTLEWLASAVTSSTVSSGHEIVREGDSGDRFYIVQNGVVRVVRGGFEVDRIGAGGAFGEMALLYDRPRNATVEAIGAVELAVLEQEVFLHAFAGSRPNVSPNGELAVSASIAD